MIGLGLRDLSINPFRVSHLCSAISSMTINQMDDFAMKANKAESEADVLKLPEFQRELMRV